MDEKQRLRHNYNQVLIALNESIKLQAHYAKLLNMHDGGERKSFQTIDAWLNRLVETKTIKSLIPE